jgi:predicted small lipoprotein YifL
MHMLNVASLSTLFAAALMLHLAGCGSSAPKPDPDKNATETADDSATVPPIRNPRDIPLGADRSATLTVVSNPPGCLVLVNMVPVRNENEGLALTPCEFSVPHGSHSISVERPGGIRMTQPVEIDGDRELEFDVSASPSETDEPSVLNAPLFEAAIGRTIPLATLNTTNRELDPFLTSDARTIYFASDRDGMRGVYTATRPTPYHDFSEPAIVSASSGADLPVSPSVSEDGLTLVYAVAEKARLWQLIRADIESPFENKEITRSDEKEEREWRSAQLSSDGLRIYWTEQTDDATVTRAATRSAPTKLFGKTLAFELPGHHPHLSADGLRQFTFDGKTLQRSRRGSIRQPFGSQEVVAELSLDGYTSSPRHRQFWLTEDEQWLIFCDNPDSSGDLFIARLSDGPGWGRQIIGKTLAVKPMIAGSEPESQSDPTPTDTIESRSQPLPYTKHWKSLVQLFEANQGDQAVALVQQALTQKNLQGDRELLNWDLKLAEDLAEFNRDVARSVQSLKPGEVVRAGGIRFEFQRAEGQTLHLKLKDKDVTKQLADLSPGERIALAETGQPKAEGARAFRYGMYLFFQGDLHRTVAESWFKRSEDEADTFYQRLAYRVLYQGNSELARGNVGVAMTFLDRVASVAGAETDAAKQASQVRGTLYDTLEWNPVGPRKWQRGEQGEYAADATRSNGSYLSSAREYGDFAFSCEWKVTEPNAMGGVYLRYGGQGKPLENGAKIHLANDSDLTRMDRFATGSLFAVASPSRNASLPAGQWNTLKIQVRGSDVQVWINDKDVLKTTLPEDVAARGTLMLDGVAGGIRYRKVILYDLAPSGTQSGQ